MVFVSLRNASADDLAAFALDLENEFFFVRIHLARHDLIDLPADIRGLFFRQILYSLFPVHGSSFRAAGITPRRPFQYSYSFLQV